MDAEARAERLTALYDKLERLLVDSRLLCAGSRDYRQQAAELRTTGRELVSHSRSAEERTRRQALALLERTAERAAK